MDELSKKAAPKKVENHRSAKASARLFRLRQSNCLCINGRGHLHTTPQDGAFEGLGKIPGKA